MLIEDYHAPILSGLDEDSDWDACVEFEDRMYDTFWDARTTSEEQWDRMVQVVRAKYDEYFSLYE